MTNTHETSPEVTDEVTEKASSRRAALRALAVGGGAAAGVVAFGKSASAAPEPGALELGAAQTNTSTTATSLVHTPAAEVTEGPSALSVGGAVPAADAPFPANVGGYGNDLVANGLHGSTTAAAGYGVVAANLADAAAAATDPVPVALALAAANGAQIRFVNSAQAGPSEGSHTPGELYVDADYTLWYSVPSDEPGEVNWISLAASTGGSTGAFTSIDPQRAYDSRQAGFAPNGGEVIAPNTSRVISVANGHDGSGTVTLADAVPEGATAVQINLTAANPTAENFLAVTSGDVETTQTSVLNWGAGELQIANSITVPVNAEREIRVYCGDQSGSTHFIVDVFGYYA